MHERSILKERRGVASEFVLHLFVGGEFTRVLYDDIVDRLVAVTLGNVFDVLDNVHSFEDASEHCKHESRTKHHIRSQHFSLPYASAADSLGGVVTYQRVCCPTSSS